jgi:predicted deacylase
MLATAIGPVGAAVAAMSLAAALPVTASMDGLVVLDSGHPGPKVLVVGGIHGNEPSGAASARALARGAPPRRGILLVVPEANPEALAASQRVAPPRAGAPAPVDLNRAFPGKGPGREQQRAAEIFRLALGADLVLDLHEEGAAWKEADRPTLVVSPASASFALDLLEALERSGVRFAFTGGAPAGSLVGELGALGRKALVVEVPARLGRAERVALHLRVVEAVLGLLEMR